MSDRVSVDVVVTGAGHAGLNAVKEIRRVTDGYFLVNGGSLGTTCAWVGCMPSRVAIHRGDIYAMCKHFQRYGIDGAESPSIDGSSVLGHIRDLRDTFVDLVLANTTDEMEHELVDGHARFIDPHCIEVGDRTIRVRAFVIAAGASSIVPAGWRESFGDAILTVEDRFELERLPKSLAVIGLGPIGLGFGQALRRLAVDVVGFGSGTTLARLDDPNINQAAVEIVRREFPIWLGAPAQIERADGGVLVRAADREQLVEKVLVAIGRRPNLARPGLEGIGCQVDERGVPLYDPGTLQIGRLPSSSRTRSRRRRGQCLSAIRSAGGPVGASWNFGVGLIVKVVLSRSSVARETIPPAIRARRCAASSGSGADSTDTGEWELRSCGVVRVRTFAAAAPGGRAHVPALRPSSSNLPDGVARETICAGTHARPEAWGTAPPPGSRGHGHALGLPVHPTSRPRNGPTGLRRPDSPGPSRHRLVHGAPIRGGPRHLDPGAVPKCATASVRSSDDTPSSRFRPDRLDSEKYRRDSNKNDL